MPNIGNSPANHFNESHNLNVYESEECSSVLVSAPGGSSPYPGITTTDLTGTNGYGTGDCTSYFMGLYELKREKEKREWEKEQRKERRREEKVEKREKEEKRKKKTKEKKKTQRRGKRKETNIFGPFNFLFKELMRLLLKSLVLSLFFWKLIQI